MFKLLPGKGTPHEVISPGSTKPINLGVQYTRFVSTTGGDSVRRELYYRLVVS